MKLSLSLLVIVLIFGCTEEPIIKYDLAIINDYQKNYTVRVVTYQPYYPLAIVNRGYKCALLDSRQPINAKSSVEFKLDYAVKCVNFVSVLLEEPDSINFILIDSKTVEANGEDLEIRFP